MKKILLSAVATALVLGGCAANKPRTPASDGMPPGVFGMPATPDTGDDDDDDRRGPPPGAVGLPMPSDHDGHPVLGLPRPPHGPPPGAVGLPMPNEPGDDTGRTAGMPTRFPPGTMGMPAQDYICYGPAQEAAEADIRKHGKTDVECSVEEFEAIKMYKEYSLELQCGDTSFLYHVAVKVKNDNGRRQCVATKAKLQAG
jgi:hypothetical protein